MLCKTWLGHMASYCLPIAFSRQSFGHSCPVRRFLLVSHSFSEVVGERKSPFLNMPLLIVYQQRKMKLTDEVRKHPCFYNTRWWYSPNCCLLWFVVCTHFLFLDSPSVNGRISSSESYHHTPQLAILNGGTNKKNSLRHQFSGVSMT